MHHFLVILFSIVSLLWVVAGLRAIAGSLRLPWLRDFAPAKDEECPRISLIFAARDEEEKLPQALATLVELDYPALEIVAVDDRSKDATGRILEEFAAKHPQLRVVHVEELPAGWLGKPHALQRGYEAATGEWLLFTDADVRFSRDCLRRVATLARKLRLEHLCLFGHMDTEGFWERVFVTFFGMAFNLATQPYDVSNPNSRAYAGVGMFQMVTRKAYEGIGTHRRLRMEVVDDVKLGKLAKFGGFRSGVAVAQEAVSVRWHAGLGNLVRGVEKNSFAAAGYSVWRAAGQALILILFNLAPFVGVVTGPGYVRLAAGVGVVVALCFHAGVCRVMRVSMLYAFTMPIGATIYVYMLGRSAYLTLRQGGIVWRETFYPLDELRRGSV